MSGWYYQICGLGSHYYGSYSFGYDMRQLADQIFSALYTKGSKDTGVELVLGMQINGASYLLVSEDQMKRISTSATGGRGVNRKKLDQPHHASAYASLSPIYFPTPKELSEKMQSYVQKKSKPGKGPVRDTSRANKMFDGDNPARSSFEHQRILWRAIQGAIDFDKFFLPAMYWLASTSLVALTFQAWEVDSYQRFRTNPKILDLGLSSISCMSFRNKEYREQIEHVAHIRIAEHNSLVNKGVGRADYKYGQTETVKGAALGDRLDQFFASIESDKAFLLVYDAEQTMNALRATGVDVSHFKIGIQDLLHKVKHEDTKNFPTKPEWDNGYGNRWSKQDPDTKRFSPQVRRRSRSPVRSSSSQRPKSPPPRLSKSHVELEEGEEIEDEDEDDEDEEDEDVARKTEIYIIDVRALFLAHSRLDPSNLKGLPDMATRLGFSVDLSSRCAGNDCLLLIDAWRQMASGNAIDEQHRDMWTSHEAMLEARKREKVPETVTQPDEDEDYDPNDVAVSPPATGLYEVMSGTLRPPMDDDSEDDDLYDF